jgi:hypothetical protein
MLNSRQFSLAFLFSELIYVGLALGCFRGYWPLPVCLKESISGD